MRLHVEPKTAMVDEKNTIELTGLKPQEKVKVSAAMSLPWITSEKYEAYACFTADAEGKVDLATQQPDSGTYDWVDRMGLIVSLQKVSSAGADMASGITSEHSTQIVFTAEHQGGKETVTVTREFRQPELESETINDPFVGEVFYSGGSERKTIMVLGGSGDGGIAPLALIAGPLAAHGFNVVTVGYFGAPGLPKHLQNVPLEYFEKVVTWIEENPRLNSDGIYVHGTSKGGELALLLASRYSAITRVVANMPHAYCFQGLEGVLHTENTSSWSWNGEPLPYIKLDNAVFFAEQARCVKENKPFGVACCYVKGLELADNKEEARIKVENAQADLLLIADGQDMIWNSADGCRDIMDTLKKHNYPHQYTLLSYENMGHVSFPVPYVIPISESLNMKMGGGTFSIGGTLADNARGQADSWEKTIEFFKN